MTLPIAAAVLPTKGIRSYLYKRSATHMHRGIDLPAKIGTPVYATRRGTVAHATQKWRQGFSGYGRVVVLRHGNDGYTLSAHLDTVEVEPGEVVEEGDRIGTVGITKFSASNKTNTFATSGAHLHFEATDHPYPMRSEADRLDPVAWLLDGESMPLPNADELRERMSRADNGSDFLALLALLGGVMWLRRKGAR